jgi:alkylated DNA repair dioxygenase AlkB
MYLFDRNLDPNILPFDGEVFYHGPILNHDKGTLYYKALLQKIEWEHEKAFMFGKLIVTKRKVAWYGNKGYSYTYSKRTKQALPWTEELKELKKLVEIQTGETYNSCLLNLYHNGNEGMGWHSDNEKELLENAAIASLSLGATRKFMFKHKESKTTIPILLESNSLLLMKGSTQKYWQHRLPPTKKVATPRINLTFRTIDL